MSPMKQSFWQSPLTRSSVPKDKVDRKSVV